MMKGGMWVKGKVLDVMCEDMPYKRLFPECEWVGLDRRPVGDIQADPHRMPLPDNEFDTVLVMDALHVAESPLMVMNESVRVLKPGGKLIVSAPNTYPDDRQALWGITGRGMEYLATATQKLIIEDIIVEGRVFSHEFAEEYGAVHDDLKIWLNHMDTLYPQITFLLARKKEED